ncbi:MAG: hypothetical protein ACLR6J_01355 [Parabacteroides merdae]
MSPCIYVAGGELLAEAGCSAGLDDINDVAQCRHIRATIPGSSERSIGLVPQWIHDPADISCGDRNGAAGDNDRRSCRRQLPGNSNRALRRG